MSDVDPYTLSEEIGRGALGRVHRVIAPDGRVLAGKILHTSHQSDERALARFAGEAEIVAELRHENVASVYGIQEIEGEQVLLMELVEGKSLAQIIAQTAPVGEERLIELGIGIAKGLTAAHRAGLIHRDLKPDNILVAKASDTPKLVDFGLSRATSFAGVEAEAFAVVGTPDYMAPESVDPLAVDLRSDLYALGCILYEMATGRPPFSGSTAFALIEAHRKRPVDVEPLNEQVSPPLARLIESLLCKSPADRPQSAAAVGEALGSIASQGTEAALVLATNTAITARSTCARCGSAVLPELSVCFDCGQPQATLEAGDYTVFVTGPGATTDKLSSGLRHNLVSWLEANRSLGLDPKHLKKKAPRLPFVMATGVSEASALGLCRTLEMLGLEVEMQQGGRSSLPAIRDKAITLAGRRLLIMGGSLIFVAHHFSGLGLALLGAGVAWTALSGAWKAIKPAAPQNSRPPSELPDSIGSALARVSGVIASISQLRHRQSLRGVVQRAMALRSDLGEAERENLDTDLARLLDLAMLGTTRIDEIDSVLEQRDLRNPSDDDRVLMRERDNWAARLLEITAFLDAMRVRYLALSNSGQQDTPSLDELRLHIEALEEVSEL